MQPICLDPFWDTPLPSGSSAGTQGTETCRHTFPSVRLLFLRSRLRIATEIRVESEIRVRHLATEILHACLASEIRTESEILVDSDIRVRHLATESRFGQLLEIHRRLAIFLRSAVTPYCKPMDTGDHTSANSGHGLHVASLPSAVQQRSSVGATD